MTLNAANTGPHRAAAGLLKRVIKPPGADVKQNFDGRIVTGANFGDTGATRPTMEVGRQYLAEAARYLPQLRNAVVEYMTLGYRVKPPRSRS